MVESEARPFDIVVFGASGLTGKYVIEELAEHTKGIKWCVGGRSKERLQAALDEVGNFIGKSLKDIEIIEADVSSKDSLIAMCKKAKLVINCVGPYRFFGEQVVSAAVESGTHHIDVSGEPQFLEKMQLKYFNAAKEKKIYVIGSCGFDSIPCDVGVEFVKKNFDGDLSYVECILKVESPPDTSANFATWQSAIHGFAHSSELKPLRKQLHEKLFTKKLPRTFAKIPKRPILFKSNVVKRWCIPFIGSDRSVVMRTQLYNYEFRNHRPAQVQTYMSASSWPVAIGILFLGLIFSVLARFSFGRQLLEKYPELFSWGTFSKSPLPREKADQGSFSITFFAKGWSEKLPEPTDQHTSRPDKKLKAIVTANGSAYIATAVCVVTSSLIVLSGNEKLPDVGGVFTPGSAFYDTTLVQRLQARGLNFHIVE